VLLHDRFASDPELRKELRNEYQVVYVDVGHMDKNADLIKKYHAEIKGVPYLTILDANGEVVVNQQTEPFETKEDGKPGHDPAKLLAFLKEHAVKALVAQAVLSAGLKEAAKDNHLVFLHFGAPWCGWCHRLDDWLARPEVAAILGKEFVNVKIDTDRMEGAKEVFARFNPSAKRGIPWFAFLDADGKLLATSNDEKGENIGFPYEPPEVDHFVKMLQKTRKNLTEDDIAKLAASLRAEYKPRNTVSSGQQAQPNLSGVQGNNE
jgi:thiol-disulfide isomerase/thioredoxin